MEWLFEWKWLGMSVLELVAVALTLLGVALAARENVLAWPIGAVSAALYVLVFARAKLYADAGLNVVFLLSQFYGWYEWLRGETERRIVRVTRTPLRWMPVLVALGTAGTLGLGFTLGTWTDQALPYWDSGIAAFSLVAQWMLARKLLENWIVWIVVDAVAVGVYTVKELYPTAVLYTLLLVLAGIGYWNWRRGLRSTEEPT